MNSTTKEIYLNRIYKVQDYIEKHIGEELTLEKLADVANFSPFHFHRTFSALVGETLYQYIQRVSLEKAAGLLKNEREKPIIDISLECGFSNPSAFTRAFKKNFGVTPTDWRKNISKNGIERSKISEEGLFSHLYTKDEIIFRRRDKDMSKISTDVRVVERAEVKVAYVRNTGAYAGNEALFQNLFDELCRWAGPRQLLSNPKTQWLTIYHDNPEITDENMQRISVCITVPDSIEVEGSVGTMTVAGGKYAVGKFELSSDEFGEAWTYLCGEWLPQSGYQAADIPAFELYLNNPEEHPEKKHIVEIYIPIKPL